MRSCPVWLWRRARKRRVDPAGQPQNTCLNRLFPDFRSFLFIIMDINAFGADLVQEIADNLVPGVFSPLGGTAFRKGAGRDRRRRRWDRWMWRHRYKPFRQRMHLVGVAHQPDLVFIGPLNRGEEVSTVIFVRP